MINPDSSIAVNYIRSLFSSRNDNIRPERAQEWADELLEKTSIDKIKKACDKLKFLDVHKITLNEIYKLCGEIRDTSIQKTRTTDWERKYSRLAHDAWMNLQNFCYNQRLALTAKETLAVEKSGIEPFKLHTANEILWFKIGNAFMDAFEKINYEEISNYEKTYHYKEFTDYKNEFYTRVHLPQDIAAGRCKVWTKEDVINFLQLEKNI